MTIQRSFPSPPATTQPIEPSAPALVAAVRPVVDSALTTHIQDELAHPSYDDLPSLSLIFTNGLV